MASYQRVALFLVFDALERDIISYARRSIQSDNNVLSAGEREKAQKNLLRRERGNLYLTSDDFDLLHGLDLGEKFQILMRNKAQLSSGDADYITSLFPKIQKAIPIRNDTMHGRPLTVADYGTGFSLANELISNKLFWPELRQSLTSFNADPAGLIQQAVTFVEEENATEVLNNLPPVDYDDTGFVSRPKLEGELKQKILGRHPVITVQGDGGNGKTALAYKRLTGFCIAQTTTSMQSYGFQLNPAR